MNDNNNNETATGNAIMVILIMVVVGFGVYFVMTLNQEDNTQSGSIDITLPSGDNDSNGG